MDTIIIMIYIFYTHTCIELMTLLETELKNLVKFSNIPKPFALNLLIVSVCETHQHKISEILYLYKYPRN